jgi:N-carbamoylputrescine amidase
MKITVCQLHNAPDAFAQDWDRLVAHVRAEESDLVLLPEMPFFRWFPLSRAFDAGVWRAAVAAHTAGERRLAELAPAVVLGTRPIDFGNVRYNAGFAWHAEEGIETVHAKAYLTREEGAWESTWYHKAVPEFVPATMGDATVGMLIGSELWVMEQARVYGEDDVHIIAVPRVTGAGRVPSTTSIEGWLAGGCAAAVTSGAYCISSSRAAGGAGSGGPGWIISPDGIPLATTSDGRPFVSMDIDLAAADEAKETYPRYMIFDVSVHRPLPPGRSAVQAGQEPV